MDAASKTGFSHPINLTGSGSIVLSNDSGMDVIPWLKQKKMKKFMGKQDQLAVIAASLAVRDAGISEEQLHHRTGVYLCVGYIPFEQQEIETIARNSTQNGLFSMDLFSSQGFDQVNPLLTFRCLPNMPIFHVSLNLNIQGPYFITYPGPGQFYVALEQAIAALESGEVDCALVGGVADQSNFLVNHHYQRMGFNKRNVPDAAGFLCLQRDSSNRQLIDLEIQYNPSSKALFEQWGGKEPGEFYGSASLPVLIDRSRNAGQIQHSLRSPDGIEAQSTWLL